MRLLTITIVLVLLCPVEGSARRPNKKAYATLFAKMDQSLKEKKQAKFKELWHPEGFEKNLVGGSGLTGKSLYRQGSRKGWYLKPNLKKLMPLPGRLGGPWIVQCDIWSRDKGRAVDQVFAFPAYDKKHKLKMLGAGEKLEQVVALARRWVKKQPLAPKKKSR